MPEGTVLSFSGSWSSGIALLEIKNGRGIDMVNCEASPTIRAFRSAYPDGNPVGKRIRYSIGELGLLAGFTPMGV